MKKVYAEPLLPHVVLVARKAIGILLQSVLPGMPDVRSAIGRDTLINAAQRNGRLRRQKKRTQTRT